MKLKDKIAHAVQTGLIEARRDPKQMAKLIGASACIMLGMVAGVYQLWPRSDKPGKLVATPEGVARIEQMAAELEAATAEETEVWQAAIAAGEVEPPAPPDTDVVAPLGPKGMNYKPSYDPTAPPANEPEPEPEPDPDDPG